MPLVQMEDTATISEADLVQFESKWQIELPAQYRLFLRRYNGGYPDPTDFSFKSGKSGSSLSCFFGVKESGELSLDDALSTFKDRIPKRMFPVADDQGGNLICISLSGQDAGNIYFWNHELEADATQGFTTETTNNLILIADSFDEFIENLH